MWWGEARPVGDPAYSPEPFLQRPVRWLGLGASPFWDVQPLVSPVVDITLGRETLGVSLLWEARAGK